MCFTAGNITRERTNQSSLHLQSQYFLLYIKSLNNRIFCNPTENVIKLRGEKSILFISALDFLISFCLSAWMNGQQKNGAAAKKDAILHIISKKAGTTNL